MSYYFSKTIAGPLEAAAEKVTAALAERGFGVLTTIDVSATLKNKLDVDFRPYVILGACNPNYAHKALGVEDKIGVMLPCNVVLQQADGDRVEVSAVDPIASMAAIENPALGEIATVVRDQLKSVVEGL